MNGQTAKFGLLRWKMTVDGSGASMLFMSTSTEAAPVGLLMPTLRSKLNLTSSAVSGEPSENFSPSFIVHLNVVGLVKSHDFAASGTGLLPPGGIVTRVW